MKKANANTVALEDSPENILNRITFYDIDSRPIEKKLSEREKQLFLREIKWDISYFRSSYQRANVTYGKQNNRSIWLG